MSLTDDVWAAGWTVVDLWHLHPPRRKLQGPFTTISITLAGVKVEQEGRADWPPCVLALLAEWGAEIEAPAFDDSIIGQYNARQNGVPNG